MSIRAGSDIDIERILNRSGLREFLEQTAKFYECGLVLMDRKLTPMANLNCRQGRIETLSLDLREDGADWRLGVPCLRTVRAYGYTVGVVAAAPANPANGPSSVALAEHVATLLTELASKEYELDDLSQEILDSYEEVNLFYDLSTALKRARTVGDVCRIVLEKACEIIRSRRASILLLDRGGREMHLAAAIGIPESEHDSIRIRPGEGISGRVLESRTPRLVDDVKGLPAGLLKNYETYTSQSFISVPLCVDDGSGGMEVRALTGRTWVSGAGERAIGVINLTDKPDGREFTSGELKLLAALASQAAVFIENIRLIEVEKELGIAREIQAGFLPDDPPALPGLDLAGRCIPARNVGGDYYDFLHDAATGEIAVLVADVSGHNVASALMMAVARSAIRHELQRTPDPGPALRSVNRTLYDELSRAELFLSIFCLRVDPDRQRIRFASAGHNPPLLLRAADGEVLTLDANGLLTGVLRDVDFTEESLSVRPGDVLLLYTDGITEAVNRRGELFDVKRLESVLRAAAGLPAQGILDRVFAEVGRFAAGVPQADDMTAIALKIGDRRCR
jgi:hypothetical protein